LILQPHQQDWRMQISAGAGVQAVVFGLFGIHPQENGSLEIMPSHHSTLGEAKLQGYRFRDRMFDVILKAKNYQVYCNGKRFAETPYGKMTTVPATALPIV
jgi:hypothetical protein